MPPSMKVGGPCQATASNIGNALLNGIGDTYPPAPLPRGAETDSGLRVSVPITPNQSVNDISTHASPSTHTQWADPLMRAPELGQEAASDVGNALSHNSCDAPFTAPLKCGREHLMARMANRFHTIRKSEPVGVAYQGFKTVLRAVNEGAVIYPHLKIATGMLLSVIGTVEVCTLPF